MSTHRRIEICCGGVCNSAPLTVQQHLEDIVVYEGGKVFLECEISGTPHGGPIWYKNGTEIRYSNRVRSTKENQCYRIDIDPVVASDFGLYTVVLQNNLSCAFSSASIYVGPPIGCNAILYTCPCPKGSLTLVKSLINATVHTEHTIVLEAEFRTEAISKDEDILWYKDNKRIILNGRIEINNTPTVSKLHIGSAKLSDSGIYTVVCRTKSGVISSTGIVQVVDVDLANYNQGMPRVCEDLPDIVEVNDDEELRLICKAKFDANTVVKWFINDSIIDNREDIIELAGYDYVGLKISPNTQIVGGKYKVVLENPISGKTDSSESVVCSNPVMVSCPPLALPRKPLTSALVNYGSEVTFDCSFEFSKSKYFYVVWYVGTIRVERSSARFDVVCKDGEYLLRIKKVEPCMAGEVVCELRQFYYDHDPLLLSEASCTLSIVPPEFLAIEQKNTTFEQTRHPTIHSLVPNKEERRLPIYKNPLPPSFIKPSLDEAAEDTLAKDRPRNTLMELTYCRLDEDVFYYLDVTMRAPSMASAEVTIRSSRMGGQLEHGRMFNMQWSVPDIKNRTWYAIDIKQNGKYVEAGISSSPDFQLKDPVEAEDMYIRIRTAYPMEGTVDAGILIAPVFPLQKTPDPPTVTLKSMNLYEQSYRDVGYEIGFGAFGRVMLTRGKSGEYYALKYVKIKSEKKKKNALREFEVMCKLQHSKVIELIDAFSDNDGFYFVMEYLWGGELFHRIVEEDHIQEMDVVTYVRQICQALLYLHSLRIAHMDLKPENIMCLSPNSKQVKLVDFGLARVLNKGEATRVIYGTKDYVAPEVLGFEPLTVACDMWSLGVITYLMLSGVTPFRGDNWVKVSANITKANYNFDETAFKDISDLGKDFISSLLVYRPNKRMTASGALNHRWIVKGPPEDTRARYMKKTKDNLKTYFVSRARWQRAGNVMIAAHRLRIQASHRSSMERSSSGT